jgi:hypothetical protein
MPTQKPATTQTHFAKRSKKMPTKLAGSFKSKGGRLTLNNVSVLTSGNRCQFSFGTVIGVFAEKNTRCGSGRARLRSTPTRRTSLDQSAAHLEPYANAWRIIRIAAVIARRRSITSADRNPCFHMPCF